MRKYVLFFTILICLATIVHFVEAHNKSQFLDNAWTDYNNWENRLAAGVVQLNKLNGKMNALKGEWDDNNEDMRAGSLASLGSIGDMSYGSFIASSAELGLDLSESDSLTSALSSAISKLESFYSAVQGAERSRDSSYANLITLIRQHNSNHNTPSVNITEPTRAPWTISIDRYSYSCGGGCSMDMNSPYSSHLTNCSTCGNDYYPCNTDQDNWHKERPCTRKIKVVKWVIDPQYGSAQRQVTYETCSQKHRWCSPKKGPHKRVYKVDGSFWYSTNSSHHPLRVVTIPPEFIPPGP